MKYKHIIWDWNGTLLNDVNLNHSLLNHLQKIEEVKLSSFLEYRKIFTFPITDLYKKAGLFKDMKSFERLADIYIKKYEENINDCPLQKYAMQALEMLTSYRITNSILTASLEPITKDQLSFYGIDRYFIALTGKKDFYASGKSELIEEHLKKIKYRPEEIIFIGDTLHDREIANDIGCDCILVNNGHQDVGRFECEYQDLRTAKDLEEVCAIILEIST